MSTLAFGMAILALVVALGSAIIGEWNWRRAQAGCREIRKLEDERRRAATALDPRESIRRRRLQ